MHLTSDLKLDFLGWVPRFEDEFLDSQSIVAFSALLSFKGKPIRALYKEALASKQEIKKKVRAILAHSSLRGHASLSTTPTLALTWRGSKFLDLMLTGIVFASGLMASGRRTETTFEDIVFPTSIYKNKKARRLYEKVSKENINFFNFLLKSGISKDEARKILQYGLVGVGTMTLPLESIVGFKKEYEAEREWMPEEGGIFLKKIEAILPKMGLNQLFLTRELAPRDVYPYGNIFKDPKEENLVRDLAKNYKLTSLTKILFLSQAPTLNLKKRILDLDKKTKMMVRKRKIKENWPKILSLRRKICRDYNNAFEVSVLSCPAWCVWTEKKRHRTCFLTSESLYYCAERAKKVFRKLAKEIKEGRLTKKDLKKIDRVFSLPPGVKKRFLFQYLSQALALFISYQDLINLGIKPSDAIFILPRGLRIDVLQNFNLYNLISGYYPLRLCQTADEEIRRLTEKEVLELRKILKKKRLGWLGESLVPKCYLCGFCPEENFCGKIKTLVPYYDNRFHQEMKKELEGKFFDLEKA